MSVPREDSFKRWSVCSPVADDSSTEPAALGAKALHERLGAVRAGLAKVEEDIVSGTEVRRHRELLRRLKAAALCINVAAQLADVAEAERRRSGSPGTCPQGHTLSARIASTRASPPMSPRVLFGPGARERLGAARCVTPHRSASNRYPPALG